jgi:hypothetical protein
VDDGPRIGGLQMLFLLLGAAPAYHVYLSIRDATDVGDALASIWFAALLVVLFWGVVVWLEVYARRRQRQERRRADSTPPSPSPSLQSDAFVRDWEARL